MGAVEVTGSDTQDGKTYANTTADESSLLIISLCMGMTIILGQKIGEKKLKRGNDLYGRFKAYNGN